jgi:hypothetical protein
MRQLFSILLAGCLSLASIHLCYAQKSGDVLLPLRNAGSDAAAVKATGQFWNTFGESRGEKWYPMTNGFLAEFTEKKVRVKVVYSQRGNWLYTLREYTAKELPEEVRAQVKSRYYDDTITWVKEVDQSQSTVYLIHMENETRWKTVQVCDGEMKVTEDFKKS